MKKLLIGFVALCILYFALGLVLAKTGKFSQDAYIVVASIAGGLASVIGLLSLVRPSISKSDIDALEVDSLRRVSKLSEAIEEAKDKAQPNGGGIAKLKQQKAEMELLVKKASLSIFLQDQMQKQTDRVAELVKENKELQGLALEYSRV